MHRRIEIRAGRRGHPQSGMSMVELLIAMMVLAIGMMGSMILVRTAIVNNNRNKLDTTATALAQMVLEQINSVPVTPPPGVLPNINIKDCAGVPRTINPNSAAAPGAGAALIQNGYNAGNIDFTQDFSVPLANNYAMLYIPCGPAASQVTYEIRWNITTIQPPGDPTAFTKLVTVSARKQIATTTSALPFFSVPVTLRGIAGQ